MRQQLLDLEGQVVLTTGYIKEWRRNGDGTANVCMGGVQVRLFDPDAVMAKVKPRKVDHLWFSNVPEKLSATRRMLSKVVIHGRVVWYERKGAGRHTHGSVDLGVAAESSLQLDNVYEDYRLLDSIGASNSERIKELQPIEFSLKTGRPYFSWEEPTNKRAAWILRELEKCRRSLNKELQAQGLRAVGTASPVLLPALPAPFPVHASAVDRLLGKSMRNTSAIF